MSFLLFLLVGINQALWAGHFFSPEKFSKECERGLSADLSKSLKNSLELISDVERHLRGAERVKFLESIIEEESSLAGNARDLLLSHLIYRHKKNILGVFVSGKRMLGRDFHILAEILLKTTKFVLYDADTEEAAAIGALLGPRGLGVSANKRKYFKTSDFRKIYITENIETKLEILNKVEHVIADDYLFFDVLTLNPDALLKKAKAAKIEPYVLLHSYNKEVDLFQGIYAEGVVNVEKDSFYPPLDFETLTDVNLFKKQILQSSSVSHLFLTASKVLERSQQGYKSSHNTKLELLYAYHHPAQSLDFSIYQNVEAWKIFKNYYQLKNEIAGMSDKTSGPDKTLSVKEKSKAEEKPEKKEEKAEKPKTLSAAWFLSQEKLDYISRILSNEKDPRNRAAKDFFAYSWVKSLMDRNNTVFLQLGNLNLKK